MTQNPEISEFIETLVSSKEFTEFLKSQYREQNAKQMADFQEAMLLQNYQVVEALTKEMQNIRLEYGTLSDVINKLKNVAAPDLPHVDEVESIAQAIDNMHKYGSIIPTQTQLAKYQERQKQNHALSLFVQSVTWLIIKKMKEAWVGRSDTGNSEIP